MCTKLFKLGLVALVAVAGLFAVKKSGLDGYAKTGLKSVKAGIKGEVPLEFEIDRLRHEVGELVPEMKRHLSVLAAEMVTVENLRGNIADARTKLDRQKENILAMRKDVESGVQKLTYDGRTYSAARVKTKLEGDFRSYQRCKSELETKESLLEAREVSLDAAREQLAAMKSQKHELELRVEQLEAQLKTVRLAQTRSKFQFDDSQLARCKAALAEVETRLKVEQKTSDLAAEFATDPIPVEKKERSAAELAKEIDQYFGEPASVAAGAKD